MMPALINGKVVPSRIEAGRISSEASVHLKALIAAADCIPGSTDR
jgi:hypothetical protein